MTSTSCRLEPAIWSRDTGQQIPCLDRCQLLITWKFNIKEVHGKPRLHLSTNLLLGVWPPCCATPLSPAVVRTRPRAIPLLMTTMRKSVHGFHFPYMAMGLRLAALWAAGAPLLRTMSSNNFNKNTKHPSTFVPVLKGHHIWWRTLHNLSFSKHTFKFRARHFDLLSCQVTFNFDGMGQSIQRRE